MIKKYDLRPNVLDFNPFKLRRETGLDIRGNHILFKRSSEKESLLIEKYNSRIPINWWGFEIECWPEKWIDVLGEFLEALEIDSPEFEVHCLKLKFGGARIHLGNISFDAQMAVDGLEQTMQDKNLIY